MLEVRKSMVPRTRLPLKESGKGARCSNPNNDRGKNTFKPRPAKPSEGSLLCLRETQEAAHYTAEHENVERYYIDNGATGHFTNIVMELHGYMPFDSLHAPSKQPLCISALGAGTLKLSTKTKGTQTTGEFKDDYYIPGRLVSLEIPFRMGPPSLREHLDEG
jgi:hypothetical protein